IFRGLSSPWIMLVLMGGNTIALLCFRHFVSLDGPMHLLHAVVLQEKWFGVPRSAAGITVDTSALDMNLGDLPLLLLSGRTHPFLLHKVLAAIAVGSVCAGAWHLTRAYDRRPNAAWLLVLPFSVGFLMVLGVFHFILGAGIALGLCGWWVSRRAIRWRQLALLLLGTALGTFAHRTGGLLALLLIGTQEIFAYWSDRGSWYGRWSALPARTPFALATIVFLIGVVLVAVGFATPVVHPHMEHHPVEELFTMRQILLVDREAEEPYRIALGVLLVALLALSVRSRMRTRTPRTGDALLAMALVLFLLSMIRTARTELHYATDRAQWLGFVLVACWIGIQDLPRWMMPMMLVAILYVHGLRLNLLEQWMHRLADEDAAALDIAASFTAGELVMPLVLDEDWLARHRTAYTAIGHHGILFTPRDHLRFRSLRPLDPEVRRYLASPDDDADNVLEHVRDGRFPVPERIVVIGGGGDEGKERLMTELLGERYVPSGGTGYARSWRRR
ncbi:MAG TPA: hypothetical protein PKL41_12735, partial [Flavobacteriales bacterium]|nr:hypothetical protein [Flavobacteriales bacterium]